MSGLLGGGGGGGGDGGAAAMRQQEDDRQARIAASTDTINKQFSQFDEPFFTNIADAFYKYQRPFYDEQLATARRELPLQFSNTANSDFQRKLGELERDATRGEADLRAQGLDFSNQQRGQVESNRADLIGMANAGTNADAMSATAASRAQALAKPPTFQPISDLFQKYTANAANAAIINAGQNGQVQTGPRPLLFNSNPSQSQRIVA